MATLAAIRAAIEKTINDNIPDISALAMTPESSISPCVIVGPATADFTGAFARGTDIWMFNLYVLVSYGNAEIAQTELDQLVSGAGPRSIRQAIFQHEDLGITNDCSAALTRMTDYGGRLEIGDIPFVGATLELKVATTGNA